MDQFFGKERWEWECVCFENGMWHWKLKIRMNTKFASKVIMFEKTLQFKNAIIICYGKHKFVHLQ